MARKKIKYHCRICGFGVDKLSALHRHHVKKHHNEVLIEPKQDVGSEIQYSFYNSPKELVLDLGEYKIRIERRHK